MKLTLHSPLWHFLFILIFLIIPHISYEKEKHVKDTSSTFFSREFYGSYLYFQNEANLELNSPAYGLIRDRQSSTLRQTALAHTTSSIAATGFGLASLVVGIHENFIDFSEGKQRAIETLKTLLNLKHHEGFFFHFYDMKTGDPMRGSEVSSIDTALLLCGVITAGEFFGEEVRHMAQELYERISWTSFYDQEKKFFYMGHTQARGYFDHWDYYAEQLALYILAAASSNFDQAKEAYASFQRSWQSYNSPNDFVSQKPFIHSWFGSLFTHQYAHAFLDFRNLIDPDGVQWFKNSEQATLAAIHYAQDMRHEFNSFAQGAWGVSACDWRYGYNGQFGTPPSGYNNQAHFTDGTIATSAAIGSIVFTPKESLSALELIYGYSQLVSGPYGTTNAFNLGPNNFWFASDYIGIDKGIGLLMMSNYKNQLIWKYFMKSEIVHRGLEKLNFSKK